MRKIEVTGLPSSGSTFIWQVLKSMGFSPNKDHGFKGGNGKISFVTYRDPRDVLCSIASRKVGRAKEQGKHHKERYNKLGYQGLVIDSMKEAKKFFKQVTTAHDQSAENKDIVMIRYEDYFPNNTTKLVKIVSDKVGKNLSDEECEELAKKHSLEENKKISKTMKHFAQMDKPTQIHGDHITSGGLVNSWKGKLKKETVQKINNDLSFFLEKFYY